MTDNERTWRDACKQVGIQCEGAIAFAMSSNPNVVCICGHKGLRGPYDDGIHCPPLGDDHATVAMLEWLMTEELSVLTYLDCEGAGVELPNDQGDYPRDKPRRYKHDTFSLALAAAVVAIKEADQ